MKSFTTPEFWKAYAALSLEMKQQAQKAYQLWKENPSHPSLHFKKVGKNLWSARITDGYRALALKKGDDYYWFWIGSHQDYDALLN
ncbi:type II toxin-antitoxin system RelE/ParE family toxin [Coleofasciculus sp. H7-2]|uniref:type II toxin-antitoxin system RelE family toxin n=1 Tax=Coleofasciculus sp. H7-2 TaxID=3351545 RepID=UPI00366D2443